MSFGLTLDAKSLAFQFVNASVNASFTEVLAAC